MPPRAARKARAVSASLQGKSAGQEAPQLLGALPIQSNSRTFTSLRCGGLLLTGDFCFDHIFLSLSTTVIMLARLHVVTDKAAHCYWPGAVKMASHSCHMHGCMLLLRTWFCRYMLTVAAGDAAATAAAAVFATVTNCSTLRTCSATKCMGSSTTPFQLQDRAC